MSENDFAEYGHRYSEGICGDGAVILRDGKPMPIEQVIEVLNGFDLIMKAIVETLRILDAK